MDKAGIEDRFAAFGPVVIRPMFGGHGVYAEGMCFAIEADGEIFLKIDAETEPAFEAAGARRFVYQSPRGPLTIGYRSMPSAAEDDDDELRRWCGLALAAARRAGHAKQAKVRRAMARTQGEA
jgi:DNA transformation protein